MLKSFLVGALALCAGHAVLAQTTHKTSKAAAKPAAATWTPDVQQYLGVQQGSFTMVGLNRLSKAQLDALISAARSSTAGDPRKHLLTCGPAAHANGKVRVLVTVAGDDPAGQRAAEIRQAIGGLGTIELVDTVASADRALHVVIQEQTLGKRTIGYTASYVTATPCTDETGGKKTDTELKGQLGTYTDPRGSDLGRDLAHMLDQDVRSPQQQQ